MNNSGYIIALSGPSGIGKGFVKEAIRRRYPGMPELTVVTTRSRRPSDGVDRETDVPIAMFLKQQNEREIILAHQPFGIQHDWYGFRRSQIDQGLNRGECMLTEIHPDNINPFYELYPSSLFVFGFIAPENYIRKNLQARDTEPQTEQERRIQQSIYEMNQIRHWQDRGRIIRLFDFSNPSLWVSIASEMVDHINILRGGIELPRVRKERGDI